MGYNTSYTLSVCSKVGKKSDDATALYVPEIRQRFDEAQWALTDTGESDTSEARWYEHEKDLRSFSKVTPHWLFVLHGEGEETGDIWTKYFLNGKMQHEKASLQIAPFDPEKLS